MSAESEARQRVRGQVEVMVAECHEYLRRTAEGLIEGLMTNGSGIDRAAAATIVCRSAQRMLLELAPQAAPTDRAKGH